MASRWASSSVQQSTQYRHHEPHPGSYPQSRPQQHQHHDHQHNLRPQRRRFGLLRDIIFRPWTTTYRRVVRPVWQTYYSYVINPTQEFTVRQLWNLFKLVSLSSCLLVVLVCLIYVAALLFWVFYWLVMPLVDLRVDLYFDFDPLSEGQIPLSVAHAEFGGRFNMQGEAHDRLKRELPVARAWLSRDDDEFMSNEGDLFGGAFGSNAGGVGRQAGGGPAVRGVLSPAQTYQVSVHLALPVNKANEDIGVFMVNTTLTAADGQTIGYSKRPAILRPPPPTPAPSPRPGLVASLAAWTPIVGSYLSSALTPAPPPPPPAEPPVQEMELYVDVLSDHWERPGQHATVQAHVTLSNRFLHIHSAQLVFACKLSGPQYFLYHYLWTTFACYLLVCLVFNMFWLMLVLVYCACCVGGGSPRDAATELLASSPTPDGSPNGYRTTADYDFDTTAHVDHGRSDAAAAAAETAGPWAADGHLRHRSKRRQRGRSWGSSASSPSPSAERVALRMLSGVSSRENGSPGSGSSSSSGGGGGGGGGGAATSLTPMSGAGMVQSSPPHGRSIRGDDQGVDQVHRSSSQGDTMQHLLMVDGLLDGADEYDQDSHDGDGDGEGRLMSTPDHSQAPSSPLRRLLPTGLRRRLPSR